jgi:hypothetical protein
MFSIIVKPLISRLFMSVLWTAHGIPTLNARTVWFASQ